MFNIAYSYSQEKQITQPDYCFQIQADWRKISFQTIERLRNHVNSSEDYIFGYSNNEDTVDIKAPYITLNYCNIKFIKNAKFSDIIKTEKNTIQENNHTTPNFIIDSTNFKFYTLLDINNSNLFYGYCLAESGILYVQYVLDPQLDTETNRKIFLRIFNSIKSNKKFKNITSSETDAKYFSNKSLEAYYCAFIFGVVLILTYTFRRKHKT